MRVCLFDLGFNCGYGVLDRNYVRSGTIRLKGTSADMATSFVSLRETVIKVVAQHKPDVIGAVSPHISAKFATPINLRPIFGFFCRLQEIAMVDLKLPFHEFIESDARKAFLGMVPRKSKDIKAAVIKACELRGWPATDDHAADALCAADFLLAKLDKTRGWDRTPLFINRRAK